MPTAQYTALANVTLGSTVSSVTFSSISGSYRDLMVVVIPVAASTGYGTGLRFNGDSGSNYYNIRVLGNGSTATSSFTPASRAYMNFGTTIPTSSEAMAIGHIMDYSATNKHKTVLARGDVASNGTEMVTARWDNTAAITSVGVQFLGNGVSGSTVALYGVK